jgi:hypothetical protein
VLARKENYFPEFDDVSFLMAAQIIVLWDKNLIHSTVILLCNWTRTFYRIQTGLRVRRIQSTAWLFYETRRAQGQKTIHFRGFRTPAVMIHTVQWILCVMQIIFQTARAGFLCGCQDTSNAGHAIKLSPSLEWLSTGRYCKEGLAK